MGLEGIGVLTMTLSNYQMAIATTGLTFGPSTNYVIESWEGVGNPGVRTNDREAPYDHGTFLGPEYLEARQLTINLKMLGSDDASAQALLDALSKAWYFDATTEFGRQSAATYLQLQLPGQSLRRLYGRPRQLVIDNSKLITGHPSAVATFFANDPRWYSDAINTQGLALGAATTGFGFNLGFNFGFGGTSTSGTASVTNAGTFPTYPVITLTGPLTNVTLTNQTTGEVLTIALTIASGDTLTIDFLNKTVLLNGTASRYFAKSGTWWQLQPGANSISFTAQSGSGSASVAWRDAWL